MPIRALIFDFDGLILDTETPDLMAWQEIFAEHELELDHAFWCQFVGRHGGMLDVVAHLEQLAVLDLEGADVPLLRVELVGRRGDARKGERQQRDDER